MADLFWMVEQKREIFQKKDLGEWKENNIKLMGEQGLIEHMEKIGIKDQQFLKEDLDQKEEENSFITGHQYKVDLLRREEILNKGFLLIAEISFREDTMISLAKSILNKSIHNNKTQSVEKIQADQKMVK